MSRRALLTTLAGAGLLSGTASADEVGVGGGDMADEIADLRVKHYVGTFSERPDAGVANRVYEVEEDDESHPEHGAVYFDDGSSWSLVDRKYGTLSAEDASIAGALDRTPGSEGYIIKICGKTDYPETSFSKDNRVLVYDIEQDEVGSLDPTIYDRSEHVSVLYNGEIWVFGGDGTGGDKVESFDLRSGGPWQERTSLGTGRGSRLSSNGVVIDGKVYICGGTEPGVSSGRIKTVEEYDLDNETVTQVSDMPVSHSFGMQAAHDGYLWLITGNSDEVDGGQIQRYDPSTDSWDGPSNFTRHPYNATDLAGVQIGNEFHTIGGWDSSGSTTPTPARHYAYEMDNDNWRLVRELDTPYSHGKAAWDGTYIWRMAGRMDHGTDAFTNSIWRYHREKGLESSAATLPEAAYNFSLIYTTIRPHGR